MKQHYHIQRSTAFLVVRRCFLVLFIAIIVFGLIMIIKEPSLISADTVKTIVPDNRFLAAFVLILLYILKGISMFFPASVLNMLSGIIFGFPGSFVVSILGISAEFCIIYLIGRYLGNDAIETLKRKSKKTEVFSKLNTENAFFVSFFLRIMGLVSFDMGSLYLGAVGIDFKNFYFGSMLGAMVEIILTTIIGEYIFDLTDWKLWLALGIKEGLALISLISYVLINKLKKTEIRKQGVEHV